MIKRTNRDEPDCRDDDEPSSPMSTVGRPRQAAGGGIEVEISAHRIVGWVNRFAGRNTGVADLAAHPDRLEMLAGDGTVATIRGALRPDVHRPSRADRGAGGASGRHRSAGFGAGARRGPLDRHARDGVVLSSSTDRAYLQGRTAAAAGPNSVTPARRDNQLTASLAGSAGAAARILLPLTARLGGLVLAGDSSALRTVMAQPALKPLAELPSRVFGDIAEPRRTVLDAVAKRSLVVRIVVRTKDEQRRFADG